MAASEQCCLIGRGKVYAREYVNTCCDPLVTTNPNAFQFLGNISNFALNITENTRSVQDFTTSSGGTDCSLTLIDTVTLNMDFNCYSAKNLALAFFGDDSEVVGGTGFVENLFVGMDLEEAILPLTNIPDEGTTPVVVTSRDGSVTHVAGVDYEVTAAGIRLLPNTTIPSGTEIVVTYDYSSADCVEMITGQSKTLEIFFDGMNCANGESAFTVKLFRVVLSPVGDISFITDDFESFTMTGTVQKDSCQTGTGISQYGKIQLG